MESDDLQRQVDLQEFHLEKGQYFIQLLYFAGKRVHNFVCEDEVLNDMSKLNLMHKFFKGALSPTRLFFS